MELTMHPFSPYTQQYLEQTQEKIKAHIFEKVAPLKIEAWTSPEPLPFSERTRGEKKSLAIGQSWGKLFDCAWFHFTGTVPESCAGKHVVLVIDVNGELCVFDESGTPVRGLTSVNCIWATENKTPVKRILQVNRSARGGESIDIWADAGANDLFGTLHENGRIREAHIAVCHDDIRDLYYDYEVLLDLVKGLPEETRRHAQLLNALNDAAVLLRNFNGETVARAREILAPFLQAENSAYRLQVSAIGHSHMDLAWLWPIRETIRKGARTFATAIELMDRYPDYIYCASQPQLYKWMQDFYPGLYEKIKTKVREGRIDPVGAMWVESDTNVPSGESLVRQILYGKQYFKQEFGLEIDNLFLPDVFGYTAALPQILLKSDIKYFTTQKLSWNLLNKFPYQSFHWQGIDGSRVLAHMLPEETYNSAAAPHSVQKVEANYKNKDVSAHALLLFGIGDGGGGPSAEHLERLQRMKNLDGLPPVRQEKFAEFISKWEKDADRFPLWVGELYLERHQGTLTTHARNKRYNRLCENALRELELTSVVAGRLFNEDYPANQLLETWREVLLYQFHDILPGSSIKRVYDECVPRYEKMLSETQAGVANREQSLSEHINTTGLTSPLVLFNWLNWEREEWLKCGDTWQKVRVPSMGYVTVDAASKEATNFASACGDSFIENDLLKIKFDKEGAIVSVWDKDAGREVLAPGGRGNRLAVYFDEGDAWDMPLDYAETEPRYMSLTGSAVTVDGPQAIMQQQYRLGHSLLNQKIILTQGSRRIDFETTATWRETKSMLRTSFPVDIHAGEATFDIQFGFVLRPTHNNTSWDLAKQEVPAHKWADLSETDYGVALLNDCKYGYKIKGNTVDLDLIRSAPYPGPVLVKDEEVKPGDPHDGYTDQCDHVFTYSLYPHTGDAVSGQVYRAAYELNHPLRSITTEQHNGDLPSKHSFLHAEGSHVIVDAVKKAEESNYVIIRLHEEGNRRNRVRLIFPWKIRSAEEVNLMEQHPEKMDFAGESLMLELRPFEVKTLKIGF